MVYFRSFWIMMRRLLQFLKHTSIKGIPRIFRTKSYFLRAMWAVSVIGFLFMGTYQVYTLIVGYLEYASVVSMTEYHVDLAGITPQSVRLPDITFCNMNPFAVDTENITDIPSLESFYRRIMYLTRCEGCSLRNNSLLELRAALLTTRGYYLHLGKTNTTHISHTGEEFLASCTVEVLFGMVPRKLPCDGIVTRDRYFDHMYYNCYTLKVPLPTPTQIYVGVVVALHLNNYPDIIEQQKYLDTQYVAGHRSGALMTFHSQTQTPDLTRNVISLPSGFFMSAKLRFVRKRRLSHPYGICKHIGELTGAYQQTTCISSCLQDMVLSVCHCIDDGIDQNDTFGQHELAGQFPPCLSVNFSTEWLMEKWQCRQNIYLKRKAPCLQLCPPPCEQLFYDYDVSIYRD